MELVVVITDVGGATVPGVVVVVVVVEAGQGRFNAIAFDCEFCDFPVEVVPLLLPSVLL